MSRYKKPFPAARVPPKKQPPLGLVIALAAAGGVVVGSAGTYFLSPRPVAQKESAPPATGGTPQAQAITPPAQQQFTPAPQPPGDPPPGKVWSVEHGHWHDAPIVLTNPAVTTVTSAVTTTIAPPTATGTPAVTTTPTPAVVPPEKKE